MHLVLVWALVALIGGAHCKCSRAPIIDDERSIAYACTNGDLNDLDEISSEAEWIEFSVARFHRIPDNAFWKFKNLRRLSFYNCHVNVISPAAFSGLDRLEWLIFFGTKIHVARTDWFRYVPNLRKLILDRCGLIHVEPDVFRALQRLETLGLRDNDLDCLPIEELSNLRSLRAVRIDGNPWLCECRQGLERFFRERSIVQEEECARWNTACRNFQCMTQIGIPLLPSTLSDRRLITFDRERTAIRGNEFQTSVLTSLDRLPDKTTWIEISGLRIDTLPKYAFFRFGNSLRSLELNDCSISTIESGAFAGLHKLQRLSLTGNRFSAVGSDWFTDLFALQQLVLQRNSIREIERTAFWHLSDSLRHLDIRDNNLRCLAIEELAELRKLERLDAIGNPWTCACRENLQNFLNGKNVGFQISAGRCYENENDIPQLTGSWQQQQNTTQTTSVTGNVHWTSFEQTIGQSEVTVVRPTPPTIEVYTQTPPPSVYQGTCHAENTGSAYQIYTCTGIPSVEELGVIPPTTHTIRVMLSNIRKIPENAFARFNGYLSRLELRDCGIEKIAYGAFNKLYNLEYLSLHSNQLNSVTSDTLQGLHRLQNLDLSHNHISRITNDAFDALPYLKSLDISENRMNCFGIEYMDRRLPYLTSLSISGNPWSCLCGNKLAELLDKRQISYDKNILLHGNGECHVTGFSGSTTLPASQTPVPTAPTFDHTTQTVEGTCVSYDEPLGIRYRCNGGNLLLLQTIPQDVIAIEFYEGHLPHLPEKTFSRFTNLRELIIRNSGLTTVEQGAFEGLDNLKNLTIQDNPLNTIGSSWFVLKDLERLDLRGNSIRYIAPGAFRYLTQLSYLNLEGNDLKCIFTSDLNDMPNVYIIEFSGNPLKWRCRVELEQFLEARKIMFVRIENSCEGKKLVRNLLLQNRTDGSFDCPSKCSAASNVNHWLFITIAILPVLPIWIR